MRILPPRAAVRSAAAIAVVALAATSATVPSAGAAAPAVAAIRAITVIDTPVLASAFEVARDGAVLYAGPDDARVRIWTPASGTSRVFATVPRGIRLLGLTLHPDYPVTPYVYVQSVVRTGAGIRLQLGRFTTTATGVTYRLLRDVAPIGTDHSGGKLTFTPDGKLVLVVGDGENAANAQNPSVSAGKVLRLTPLGAPAGPGGSPVWASGFRNSIGLAFDPVNGALWETENGPECGDELNRVRAGGNYGWGPSATCAPGTPRGTNQDGPSPILPATWYKTPAAPTGAEFCNACGLPGAQGGLLYGRYLDKDIRLATLNAARTDVASERTFYQNDDVLLGVERDPRDGSIWFSDSHHIKRLSSTSSG